MVTRIQIRRDTSAAWAATDPVLSMGEQGLDTTIGKVKVGDGVSAWSALPWLDELADGSVTAVKLDAGAVTEGKIATGAVTTDKLGALAVGTAKIANAAIVEGKIGAGAVTESKLGAASVSSAKIAAGAIAASHLGAKSVDAAALATDSVGSSALIDGAVTAAKLGAGVVGPAAIAADHYLAAAYATTSLRCGGSAGVSHTGVASVLVGISAGENAGAAIGATGFGYAALQNATGNYNLGFGFRAGQAIGSASNCLYLGGYNGSAHIGVDNVICLSTGVTPRLTFDGTNWIIPGIPTADPAIAGALWADSGVLMVSEG